MIDQIFIAVTELIAIWLIQDKRIEYRKYACLFGLLGQPFWFYSSFMADQWGSFVLCFFFAAAWLKALKEYWIYPETNIKPSKDEYYELLIDALNKLENGQNRLDYKDYIKRIMKEALGIK
jgi:hypothetical protein